MQLTQGVMDIPALDIAFSEQERRIIMERIDDCLSRGALSQGRYVQELEERFARYVGVTHAIAVNSGTSAIEAVMRVLEVKGQEVLVPANTFIATASSVLFAGGHVRLVDIDPRTFSVSLAEIKKQATSRTRGVIIVHIGGIVTPEIEEIRQWCDEQGLWLFEDAAHAHGSRMAGKGAGAFGIAGSYSFFATKIITSGEGGIIVTNDHSMAEKLRMFRNHGKPQPWETYHTSLGNNYRMSDITATIALTQFERLDAIIEQREAIANRYTSFFTKNLPDFEIVMPQDRCSWYKYIVIVPLDVDSSDLKDRLKEKGVSLQGEVYATPLHRQPIAASLQFGGEYPLADDYCRRHICLPIYPNLTDEQIDYVLAVFLSVVAELRGQQ
ncbi:DegT/DnrJ/EryC1/StrS family aminotransferase [Paenibacillus odorifer]|jgi:perosamine synthetase|uniref:DegT/DnrJ/EryC1/StrS family aminotransferase n=1 Tax=Paenibacillus odorifer TaxID=189426 RepID=UPI001C37DA89|nr:DegT/DnrJ/EryC1/StrS family aminotransferase [Paenibacillus odorifer]